MDAMAGLAAIVGDRHVLCAPEDLLRFNEDGRGAAGGAAFVVRPGTTAEVSAIVRLAARRQWRIVPQGGRTGLVGAGVAEAEGDLLLSLERLARAPVIDPVNRTATVDAGVALSALETAASEHGLAFPIDLGSDPSVGGMVAANTGGARLLRYGDVRRNILGLEVVLADAEGTVVQLGAPLWKDNSGVDLKQLFIGTSGSFGIVTAATLALQPRPANAMTALVALSRPAAALAILTELERHCGPLLTAFEGMSARAMAAAFAHKPSLRNPFASGLPPYALLIELSAPPLLGEALLEDALCDVLGAAMARPDSGISDVALDPRGDFWRIRHSLSEGLRAKGRVIACDVAVNRRLVFEFRDAVAREVEARWPAVEVHDFGHIGDGGVHFNMVWPRANGPLPDGLAQAVQAHVLDRVVGDFGGSFSAEHGIGPRNLDHYRRHVPQPVRRLAGQVQQAVAPAGIGRVAF